MRKERRLRLLRVRYTFFIFDGIQQADKLSYHVLLGSGAYRPGLVYVEWVECKYLVQKLLTFSLFVGAIIRMKRSAPFPPALFNADHAFIFVLIKGNQFLFLGKKILPDKVALFHDEL